MRNLLSVGLMIASSCAVFAQAKGVDPKELQAVTDKAVAFLSKSQKAEGNFAPRAGDPGPTALILAALIRLGKPVDDPMVAKGLAYLEKQVQKDGGVYNVRLSNYNTCIAMVTFKEANKDGKYKTVIDNAGKFLKTLQGGGTESDTGFGGFGYDKGSRPDVSNSHFTVEALLAAGVAKDDPAVKNALVFLSKCQNLPSEANKLDYAKKATASDKGGFVYNPLDASNLKSDKRTPDGGLRSEGGMTYAGLKSFLYAGVGKDDPRVKAAIDWIKQHYTLTENPGMGSTGLYYYYHVFAKAMDALGDEEFVDAKGTKHAWRQELFATLKSAQNADGSWANKNGAFLENSPELATSFALLSLSYCTKK